MTTDDWQRNIQASYPNDTFYVSPCGLCLDREPHMGGEAGRRHVHPLCTEHKVWGTSRTKTLNDYARECREANDKWWRDPETGEPIERNKGEMLMLMVSEISEAMEGERKDLMDDKLPHRRMAEVELIDALIRIFDYAGEYGYDLDGAYEDKMKFNATREDHTFEARLRAEGKKW